MATLPKAEKIFIETFNKNKPINIHLNLDYVAPEWRKSISESMQEYAKQVLDYVAENAKLNFDEAGRMRVDKESILKIKNELL